MQAITKTGLRSTNGENIQNKRIGTFCIIWSFAFKEILQIPIYFTLAKGHHCLLKTLRKITKMNLAKMIKDLKEDILWMDKT